MEVQINDETYQSTTESRHGSCKGCTTTVGSNLCYFFQKRAECGLHDIIWIKKENNEGVEMQETNGEPKYTVEEVLTVLEDYGYYTTDSEADSIKSELQKKSDLEYKQYLALKAKFGE